MMEIFQELKQVELQGVTNMIIFTEEENFGDVTVKEFQQWMSARQSKTEIKDKEDWEEIDYSIIKKSVDKVNRKSPNITKELKMGFINIDFSEALSRIRNKKLKNK